MVADLSVQIVDSRAVHLPVLHSFQPLGVRAAVCADRRAAGGAQRPRRGGRSRWIVVAMVAARSAAMGFNRLVDAEFDGRNPRTAMREIPRGLISPPCRGRLRRERGDRFVVAAAQLIGALPRAVAGGARRSCSGTRSPSATPPTRRRFSGWRWRWRRWAAGWRLAGRLAPASPGCSGWPSGCGWAASTCSTRARTSSSTARTACSPFRRGLACRGRSSSRGRCTSLTIVVHGCSSARWPARPGLPGRRRAGRGASGLRAVAGRATDLSQVKRAFDLNGYVGILYLVTTTAAITPLYGASASNRCPQTSEREAVIPQSPRRLRTRR